MEKVDAQTLNAVQQTLRTLTIALAGAAKVDLRQFAALMESGAQNPDLMPAAQAMIKDLALGISKVATAVQDPPMH